jgi:hypothetical protein
MPPRTHQLTPPIAADITAKIRLGAFPYIAAEAVGIPRAIFRRWIELGDRARARQPYKSFALAVKQAQAIARLTAEAKVLKSDPKTWLRSGPGRERPGDPGWTAVTKPVATPHLQQINLFGSPDFLAFLATLRQVLAPYPDALDALSAALDHTSSPKLVEHDDRSQ